MMKTDYASTSRLLTAVAKEKADETKETGDGRGGCRSLVGPSSTSIVKKNEPAAAATQKQPHQKENDNNKDYRVEVTVESLRGIMLAEPTRNDCCCNSIMPIQKAMCQVAFGGSSSQMQVLSSSVCGHTGRPVIESMPFVIDAVTIDEEAGKAVEDGGGHSRCWLRADWNKLKHQQQHDSLYTDSSSSSSSSGDTCTTVTSSTATTSRSTTKTSTTSDDDDVGNRSGDNNNNSLTTSSDNTDDGKRNEEGKATTRGSNNSTTTRIHRRKPLPHLTMPLLDKSKKNDNKNSRSSPATATATATTRKQQQQNASEPAPPPPPLIPQMNRDSLVLQLANSEDEPSPHEILLDSSDNNKPKDKDNSKPNNNNNTDDVWATDDSSMGDILPEIVELQVRIKAVENGGNGDDRHCEEFDDNEPVGTAYLVLFGHEQDNGNYVMELPVKQKSAAGATTSGSSPSSHSRALPYVLTDEARLRVRVKVVAPPYYNKVETAATATDSNIAHPHKESFMTSPTEDLTSTSTTLSNDDGDDGNSRHYHRLEIDDEDDEDEDIDDDDDDPLIIKGGPGHIMTRSQVEEHVGCLLQKIEKNEKEAIQHIKAQKHAIDVEVPVYGSGQQQRKMYNHHQLFSCGDFASVWNMDHLWNTISDTLLFRRSSRNCGGNSRSNYYNCGKSGGDGNNSSTSNGSGPPPPVLSEALSMDSTIYTRDSMQF